MDSTEYSERRLTASEIAASTIRDRIAQGQIEPGERLVEEKLAQELEVSRGAIREALRHLADEGAILLVPNRGATVRTVTRRWVMELFEIREILEGFIARRAAESLNSPEDIRWFRNQIELWSDKSVIDDRTQFFEQNIRFHAGIAARCGNSRLPEFMPKLKSPIPLHLQKFLDQHDVERRRNSAIEHCHLAEAILARDSVGAETLGRYHVRRTMTLLNLVPDSAFSAI